jgi:rubrerythrin
MTLSTPLDILKEAILLERRGQAFYHQVAAGVANQAIKEFFETMAEEERRHIEILEAQFRSYDQAQVFEKLEAGVNDGTTLADMVLTPDLMEQIGAAGYEAAAISAAILMEEKAVTLYSQRAAAAQDTDERNLYQWLADWEQGHLRFLVQLDKEIRQAIWQDSGFWPF